MRILLTTATYPPSTNGVAVHTQLLFHELIQLGHDVQVLAPEHKLSQPEPHVIHYPSLPNPVVKDYPVGVPLISPRQFDQFKPEVIHTQHPLIIAQVSAYLANRYHCPLFFTHHTRYQEYIDYYIPTATKLTAKLFNQHLVHLTRLCHTVICPSRPIKAHLHQLGVNNTLHLPNGIDTHQFQPVAQPPQDLSLVFVGRLEPEKQPEKLLELAQIWHQANQTYRLTIVGQGRLYESLLAQIRQRGLTSVKLAGQVSRANLPQLLNQHTFFITFSKSEVMPLTYLEAQACGLPVVHLHSNATDCIPNDAEIVMGSSLPEVAKNLQQICENKTALNLLRQNSLKNAQNYSITTTAQQHLKLYNSAL